MPEAVHYNSNMNLIIWQPTDICKNCDLELIEDKVFRVIEDDNVRLSIKLSAIEHYFVSEIIITNKNQNNLVFSPETDSGLRAWFDCEDYKIREADDKYSAILPTSRLKKILYYPYCLFGEPDWFLKKNIIEPSQTISGVLKYIKKENHKIVEISFRLNNRLYLFYSNT